MTARPESFLLLPRDGLILVDRGGLVLHVNSIARQRLGVAAGALEGRPLGEAWADLEALIRQRGTDLASTGPVDDRIPWGEEFIRVRIFASDDGLGVGLLADQVDPAEPGPRQSLVESVLEAVTDAVVVTTAEYIDSPGPVILYVNSAFLAQSGYGLQEVLGRSPRLLQGDQEEEDPTNRRRFREALVNGEPVRLELPNTAKDGSVYWVEVDLVPLFDGDGVVSQWVSVQRNISERRTTQQALAEQALRDAVTGLPNRIALHSRIDQALQRLHRREGQLAVLFCDLNRFKEVNDMHGHQVGDLLLIEIASRLREALRPEDTLARLGGDEFVALAEDLVEVADAVQLALRLKERLGAPWTIAGQTFRPSMSVGIAMTGDPSVTVDELLRRADLAMYQAKEGAGAGVAIYDRSVDEQLKLSISVRRQLHQAIEGDGLVLEYQPIVDLADGEILGAEALVRLQGRDGRLIPPNDFIPQAEVTGLVVPLGEWVIRAGFGELRRWRDRGHAYSMSINVSPSQLRVPGLASYLLTEAERQGVDPSWVAIEVTETVLINHPKVTFDELSTLRDAGVMVHLDDFGTGYSSLSWLTQFPVDAVKIDKTFTADLGIDERKTAVIRAFIQVAQELRFVVVAEGIETEDQRRWLREMGCDRGQGYLFARPVRPEQASWI